MCVCVGSQYIFVEYNEKYKKKCISFLQFPLVWLCSLQTASRYPAALTCLLKYLVLLPQAPLFHLSPTTLLSFPHPPLSFGQHGKGMDSPLFLESHQLFGQEVEHVCQHPSFQSSQIVFNLWHLKNNVILRIQIPLKMGICKEECWVTQNHWQSLYFQTALGFY